MRCFRFFHLPRRASSARCGGKATTKHKRLPTSDGVSGAKHFLKFGKESLLVLLSLRPILACVSSSRGPATWTQTAKGCSQIHSSGCPSYVSHQQPAPLTKGEGYFRLGTVGSAGFASTLKYLSMTGCSRQRATVPGPLSESTGEPGPQKGNRRRSAQVAAVLSLLSPPAAKGIPVLRTTRAEA